ncbi:helix-turn-helix transcriptional regulator [Desulfovibrio sp. OttesenSCG-928-A18]|nr:helix-turn-helix transcriptional regulator [Desulfovibrio sp. OttesenSCG-928-A18]
MADTVGYDFTKPKKGTFYESNCPILHTLGVIGGKWKLPIIWNLATEKVVRYNELRRSLGNVTNMMLTKCLRELEEDGLVLRTQYHEVPPKVEYSLTEDGIRLLPALNNLYEWGEGHQLKTKGKRRLD